MLGFNDTSTLVGHFVSSPREREKSDRRDSRRDEREEQGRKRNRNESEETEEIKTFPLYHFSNFDKRVLEEQFCEIILQSGPWPRRRGYLKIFFFFFFFCSGCHFF